MKRVLAGVSIGAVFTLAIVLAAWTGVISFTPPWQIAFPDFTETEVEISLPEEARIVAVEKITLDCRARVHAEVPIEGKRDHLAFGQVYRTDTVEMTAYGDLDTCVSGHSASVQRHADGTTEVVIPGESIVFVRPRVDTVRTAETVTVDKGLVGKLTDVAPWVSDDLGLTPLAYAHAQNVIGSSSCTAAAYDVTEQLIIDAYTEQFIDQGADPDSLSVTIDGDPIFAADVPADFGDNVQMGTTGGDVTCTPADGLGAITDVG